MSFLFSFARRTIPVAVLFCVTTLVFAKETRVFSRSDCLREIEVIRKYFDKEYGDSHAETDKGRVRSHAEAITKINSDIDTEDVSLRNRRISGQLNKLSTVYGGMPEGRPRRYLFQLLGPANIACVQFPH